MKRSILYQSILVLTAVSMIGTAVKVQSLTVNDPATAQQSPPKPAPSHEDKADRGEAIFMANCARCHNPPSSIPPRITGTIVMHMRVRARLSQADQRALLHYLAP